MKQINNKTTEELLQGVDFERLDKFMDGAMEAFAESHFKSKRAYRVSSLIGLNNGSSVASEEVITLQDLVKEYRSGEADETIYSLRECDLGIDGIIDMNVNETFSYKCHRQSHCLMMISRIT
tara:strand:+ start:279 stop:644 length:366 start_codon:yes stop_codon:yes gene_type:complete